MMNILRRASQLANGVEVIREWLGEDGMVVDQDTAQHRANTCIKNKCPANITGFSVATWVAKVIRRHLEVKNQTGLRVHGEKQLHTCKECGCVLRLLIWEPQDRVTRHLSDLEKTKLPDYCWKLEKS